MKQEKVYVYIGRFQMAHAAHEATIEHAVKNADRVVILVGSSELARDERNPFTFEERKSVIEQIATRVAKPEWSIGRNVNVNILPVHDHVYNNTKWLQEIHKQVRSVTNSTDITLTGCHKENDSSTFYLDIFPQWKQDFIQEVKTQVLVQGTPDVYETQAVNSTALRTQFFSTQQIPEQLPKETKEFLTNFKSMKPEVLSNLVNEFNFNTSYKAQMRQQLPYDTIPFLTGDSLIVCAGHILVVRRRSHPGKGLLALPGGFFDAWKDQSQVDTAIRELFEETNIDVPEKVLRGNIRRVEEFGDMKRSLRWRLITKCVYIQLPDTKLPKVKGGDDAEKAFWLPLGEIVSHRDQFFEDHLSIIDTLISVV